jgi:hypothetical protein
MPIPTFLGCRLDPDIATFSPGRPAGQQFTGQGWCQAIPFRCPGGRLTLDELEGRFIQVRAYGSAGLVYGFEAINQG